MRRPRVRPPALAAAAGAAATLLLAAAAAAAAAATGAAPIAISGARCACDGAVTDCSRRHKSVVRPAELCPNTTVIHLQGNNLLAFPDGLRAFRVIVASENRLQRLPAAPAQLGAGTRVLDLARNALANSSRELGALAQLRVLRVQHNFLAALDFLPARPAAACALYVLDAANNSVSSLEGPVQDCTRLVFLNLAKNQLATVPSNAFYKLRKLKDLFLDSNMIESISENAFRGMRSLRKLSLARNLLTWLPEGLLRGRAQLRWLDASGNALSALPPALLDACARLEVLDLHANRLHALPPRLFLGLRALRELQVWKNRLTAVPDFIDSCPQLEVANFDSNNLTEAGEKDHRALLERIRRRQRH